MAGKLRPQSPSNYVFPSWGGTFHSRSSAQDHKSVPQGLRLHQVGPQEIESTPWVHTAEYLRESQANSLSKLAAPAKSANSKPGSQRAGSTWKSACNGWCQAWPQVAAGSASQAHEQPRPQAHGGSMSKPHDAESAHGKAAGMSTSGSPQPGPKPKLGS